MNKELEFFPKAGEDLTASSADESKSVVLKPLKIPDEVTIRRKKTWCPVVRSKMKTHLWCACNSDDAV